MIDKNVELKRITESLDTFSLLFMAGKVYRDFIKVFDAIVKIISNIDHTPICVYNAITYN